MAAKQLKKVLRSILVFFPGAKDWRFRTQNRVFKLLNIVHDPDFDAFRSLDLKIPAGRNPVIIDIGGNHGQSIYSFKAVLPGAQITSFEPNPYLASRLKENFASDPKMEVHSVALGPERGSFPLFVPSYRGYTFDGLASLKRAEAENWLSPDSIIGYDRRHIDIKEYNVEVTRLDDYDLCPDIIKIDVQGFEYEVLRGGTETLRKHKPVLLIEGANSLILEFLSDLGYSPAIYRNGSMIGGRYDSSNVFFFPEKPRVNSV